MPEIQKVRKVYFLLLGSVLILVAGFLWYWDWRHLGLPSPLRAEHLITILCFIVGFFVLGLFVFRLTRRQLTIMLIMMIVANVAVALASQWIFRTYPAFFELVRHKTIEGYDPVYVEEWQRCFLNPAIYAVQIGLAALWVESLAMYFVRKPTDQPE